eukprot:CFRG5962T1
MSGMVAVLKAPNVGVEDNVRKERCSTPNLSAEEIEKIENLRQRNANITTPKYTGSTTPLWVAGIGLFLFTVFILTLMATGSGQVDPLSLFMRPEVLIDVDKVASATATARIMAERTSIAEERIFSTEELAKFDGTNPDGIIFLGFNGVVYDVTAGKQYYAPGGGYSFFSGKDATRAYLTGDFEKDLVPNIDGLREGQLKELKTWENFYNTHMEYFRVGRMDYKVEDTLQVHVELPECEENIAADNSFKEARNVGEGDRVEL